MITLLIAAPILFFLSVKLVDAWYQQRMQEITKQNNELKRVLEEDIQNRILQFQNN